MPARTAAQRAFGAANNTLMLLVMIVTVYPFVHVAASSLSLPSLLVKHQGPVIWPLGFTTAAYRMVLANPLILSGYANTLLYVLTGTAVNMVVTCTGAYVLSRRGLLLRNVLMFMAVFTMFFSGGLIPYYLQVKALGLTDTRWALIFPPALNTFNLIVMRTYFLGQPESLEESARIDGAGDVTILLRIVLPLAIPVVAVMVLFYGVGHWNSWFNAMIFLRRRDLYPLQLFLREILIASSTYDMTTEVSGADKELVGETVKYATIMVATLPILSVYPFLQRYFVQGLMIGALKG
jgi:putative aldouronate transport system permease protein